MSQHSGEVPATPPRIVVVAASAGGIRALRTLLRALPADFPVPIVVVQHRAATPKSRLASVLAPHTVLRVAEAREGETIEPGVVYIARPDLHLRVTATGHFAYSDGSRISYVLSSANPLFASAASVFGPGAVAVVLTGSGSDGADGVQAIRAHGGTVIAQDEGTSEYFGMPGSAIRTGAVDDVLPLEDIAPALVRLVATEAHLVPSGGAHVP